MSRALALLACAPLALAHVPRPPAFSLKTATTDASTLLVDKVKEANEKYGLDRKIAPFKDAIFAVGSSLGLPFPGVWHMRKKHRKGGGAIYGKKRRADKKDTSETAETIQVWWFHREWVFDQQFFESGSEPWRQSGTTPVLLNKLKCCVFKERPSWCAHNRYERRRVEDEQLSGRLYGVWNLKKFVSDGGVFDTKKEVMEVEVSLNDDDSEYLMYQIPASEGDHYRNTIQFGNGKIWKVDGFLPTKENTKLVGTFRIMPRPYFLVLDRKDADR